MGGDTNDDYDQRCPSEEQEKKKKKTFKNLMNGEKNISTTFQICFAAATVYLSLCWTNSIKSSLYTDHIDCMKIG